MATPNPVLAVAGRALESVLARVLALDPDAAAALKPLEGRAIELDWRPAGIGLRLRVEDGRLRVGPKGDAPDLSISGSLAGLLQMALPARDGAGFATGRVQMSGDAELARRVSQLATKFAPDVDAAATQALGPVAGPLLARGLRDAFAWSRESGRTLAEDTVSFLRDERGDLVSGEELTAFADEVDALRDRGERLAARVRALLERS
ncbi:MAG TPA: SCP2 sterol-binding domain-containing protein [Xanthomonadales bacterium]|nr:SCP2 sterol-binding domain-containing protein [Xanthomonadales bacterium]